MLLGTVVEFGAVPRAIATNGNPRSRAISLKYDAAIKLLTLPCSQTKTTVSFDRIAVTGDAPKAKENCTVKNVAKRISLKCFTVRSLLVHLDNSSNDDFIVIVPAKSLACCVALDPF